MKKRFLSMALAVLMALTLTAPAAAAEEFTPAGFTLFRLSEKPVGGYAPVPGNYLVVEDGTRLTCPDAEMNAVRYNVTRTDGSVLWALASWLQGYDEEIGWDEEAPQTVPAGQALAIEGNAAYVVKASSGDASEELWVINRSTMMADAGEDGLDYDFYDHTTPSGTQKLAGHDYILTTVQSQGLGVAKVVWSWEPYGGSDSGITYSSVCEVFSDDVVFYAPEGYYFAYGYSDLVTRGSGGETGASLGIGENEMVYNAGLYAYGKPASVDSISYLSVNYGGKTDFAEWTLTRLTEDQLTSKHQYASPWALEQVNQAIDAGLMTYGDYANLQANAYREDFAALAVRLYETVTGKTAPLPEANPFADTEDENVLKAYALGVINGTSETGFSPYDDLTREQAATILARLAKVLGYELPTQTSTFEDAASISSWASDAVGSLSAAGIMNGVGGSRFDPQGIFSAEQAVLTVMRMYSQIKC